MILRIFKMTLLFAGVLACSIDGHNKSIRSLLAKDASKSTSDQTTTTDGADAKNQADAPKETSTDIDQKNTSTEASTTAVDEKSKTTTTIEQNSVPIFPLDKGRFVAMNGNDSNPGTEALPWGTIQKAVKSVVAGDIIFVRGGQYDGIKNGWSFQNSGTKDQPIVFTNYPGEQVVLKHTTVTAVDYDIFHCSIDLIKPSWSTPKAEYIHIIGTDVTPQLLANGVESRKGLVMLGLTGEQSYDINATGCDFWEVAGVDFVESAGGIRTWKQHLSDMSESSADSWYVHHNRVYNYYRESGMQLNGDNNRIEYNEFYKVSDRLDTPYGCQLLNLLGHGNIVRGNVMSRLGSQAVCGGLLFEWDLSDNNIVENNRIYDVTWGISFEGGDNNTIRNNIIYSVATPGLQHGIMIRSYDNQTTWPCNDAAIDNPSDPEYQYYFNPRDCHSNGNQILNNTIYGFNTGISFNAVIGEKTVIRNNAISGWSRGSICNNSACFTAPFPGGITADHNAVQGQLGFTDLQHFDFHLNGNSPLIDAGANLGSLNQKDFEDNPRPQGQGFDIGAYEAP